MLFDFLVQEIKEAISQNLLARWFFFCSLSYFSDISRIVAIRSGIASMYNIWSALPINFVESFTLLILE